MTSFASPYTYSLPRFIDTAPLHAALERICLLTFVIIADSREVLRNAKRVAKAVKELIKAETHNARTLLKWEMLLSPNWRARVLKDLGGEKALARWERLMGWSDPKPVKKRAELSPAQKEVRHQNLLKARAAKQEKDRAYKRIPTWDDTHPNIYRDRVKVDMDGQFRLAPIIRGRRKVKRHIKKATEPRRVTGIKYSKINPIPLWPIEFRAAGEPPTDVSVSVSDVRPAPNTISPPAATVSVPDHVRDDRGERDGKGERDDGIEKAPP